MKIKKEVYQALNILNSHGYEAFLVGGATRNYLLNKSIVDYDITTNADPNAIKMLFNQYKTYDIGKKLGTINVIINNIKIDITPYRKETTYINHRRPKEVIFTSSLKEDLKRRDFTINALCLDANNKIIDYFNGLDDLNNKQIKAIGNPKTRFNEDALRILRALRFKTKLDFNIEEKTNIQIHKCKDLLNDISSERKKDELLQILSCKSCFKTINEYLDVFNTFIPFKHENKSANNFNDPLFTLAYLLSKTDGYDLDILKFSKKEISLLNCLINATNINIDDDYQFIKCLSDVYPKETLLYLKQLHRKDYNERYQKLKKYCITINDLKISGNQISEYGYQGKQINKVKNDLLKQVHMQKLNNTNAALINYVKKHDIK